MTKKSDSLSLPPSATGPLARPAQMAAAFKRHAIPADLAEIVAKARHSDLLPRSITSDEKAIVIALKGRELGLPPMQAFSSIHVIQGVPTLSSSLMLGVLYRRLPTFDLQVVERSPKRCVLRGRRSPQHSPIEASYTIEEASAAGLSGKDNWKKNPADMLCARATSRLCRLVAPDTFMGLYTPDEIAEGDVPADMAPMEPVTPVEVHEVKPEPAAAPTFDRRAVLAEISTFYKDGGGEGAVKAAAAKRGLKGAPPDKWTDEQVREIAAEVLPPADASSVPHDPDNPFSDDPA